MKFWERGGIWVVSQALLMLSVLVLSLMDRSSIKCRTTYVIIAGIMLFAAGAVCGLAGFLVLGSDLTPFPKPMPQGCLVRSGIYSWVRHPLYVSVFLAAVGWSLLWQSWLALLAALSMALFFDAKARREERWLRAQFAEYADYAQRTRRFIPGIY